MSKVVNVDKKKQYLHFGMTPKRSWANKGALYEKDDQNQKMVCIWWDGEEND